MINMTKLRNFKAGQIYMQSSELRKVVLRPQGVHCVLVALHVIM